MAFGWRGGLSPFVGGAGEDLTGEVVGEGLEAEGAGTVLFGVGEHRLAEGVGVNLGGGGLDVGAGAGEYSLHFARQGCRISDIGHAVQTYVEQHGFGVVRAFVGHGVGEQMHEEPEVPNFGAPGRGPRMVKGMTIAVEPMVTEGTYDVRVLKDRWTTVTADGKLAAHYENTILITDGEPEILTVTEGL